MKKLLLFLAVCSLSLATPEVAEAQFFKKIFSKSPQRGKVKRKKSGRNVGKFAGTKSIINRQISYFNFGGGINSLNYFGDLAPNPTRLSTDISFTRPAINLTFGQKFGDRYHWGANFLWGRLSGSDFESADPNQTANANRHLRNHSFRNDIQELSAFFYVDFIKHSGNYQSRPPLVPYAFVGISVFHQNPKAQVPEFLYLNENPNSGIPLNRAGEWVALGNYGLNGELASPELWDAYRAVYGQDRPIPSTFTKRIQIALPMGLGVKYKVASNLNIAIELSYRQLFTNYLDGIDGSLYVDPSFFLRIHPEDPVTGFDDAYTAMALADRSMELYHHYNNTEGLDFATVGDKIYTNRINDVRLEFDDNNQLAGYRRHAGYGADSYLADRPDVWNTRGNPGNNDMYFVTNIRVTYILSKSFVKNAKFR